MPDIGVLCFIHVGCVARGVRRAAASCSAAAAAAAHARTHARTLRTLLRTLLLLLLRTLARSHTHARARTSQQLSDGGGESSDAQCEPTDDDQEQGLVEKSGVAADVVEHERRDRCHAHDRVKPIGRR